LFLDIEDKYLSKMLNLLKKQTKSKMTLYWKLMNMLI